MTATSAPDEECIHLLVPDDCSICNGTEARATREANNLRAWAVSAGDRLADYPGFCWICEEAIEEGEAIVYRGKGWVHRDCG